MLLNLSCRVNKQLLLVSYGAASILYATVLVWLALTLEVVNHNISRCLFIPYSQWSLNVIIIDVGVFIFFHQLKENL